MTVEQSAGLFLLYSPLNQGLKQAFRAILDTSIIVFTLQSIKSRIETMYSVHQCSDRPAFLLYSPLNQGLKPYSL